MSSLVTTNNEGFTMKCSSSELFSRLSNFRQDERFCDFSIKIGSNEFHAHKAVLAAASPYFETMFLSQFVEAQQSTVVLDSIEADVMEIILDFVYGNLVHISHSNVQAVMDTANYFQIESLFNGCCDYLEENINTDNCCSILRLPSLYLDRYPVLFRKAKEFIIDNFGEVCQRPDFLELDPNTLLEIIKNDDLNVEREDTVFGAVVRWQRYKEERIIDIDKLLCRVRLAFVDPIALQKWADSVDLCNCPTTVELIEEVRKYHLLPSRRSDVLHIIRRRRNYGPEHEVLILHSKSGKKSNLECINKDGDLVINLEYPPEECRNIVVSNYTKMTVASCWDKLYQYSLEGDTWLEMAANLKPRYFSGLCELDGFWYSIGGKIVGGRTCGVCEKYDVASKTWQGLPLLPVAVSSPAVVCREGMIYVIGGLLSDNTGCNLVQRYDPHTKSWVILSETPVPLQFPAACVLDGMIFIFCFSRKSFHPKDSDGRRVFVYDPSSDQWKVRSNMPLRFLGGPVFLDGYIYVLCEYLSNKSVIMRYVPYTDCWEQFGDVLNFETKLLSGPFVIEDLF